MRCSYNSLVCGFVGLRIFICKILGFVLIFRHGALCVGSGRMLKLMGEQAKVSSSLMTSVMLFPV